MIAAFFVVTVTDLFWSLVQDGAPHLSRLFSAALWIAATLLSAAGLCTRIFYKRRSHRRAEP
ncbi:MAG: hypothetical protein VB023_11780 [Oscillibacter sp.]|nr:hypothetical protein [Oscillibacter sp.]